MHLKHLYEFADEKCVCYNKDLVTIIPSRRVAFYH